MPQMMPIYWFFIFVLVNLFIHFFFSFYYYNFLVFEGFFMKKSVVGLSLVNYLK